MRTGEGRQHTHVKYICGNDVCHAYTYMRYQRDQRFASARMYIYVRICVLSESRFSDGDFGDLLRIFSPECSDGS